MNFNKIKYFTYAFFLTRKYGKMLENIPEYSEKKRLRLEYTKKLFSKLNLRVHIEGSEKVPFDGQYLVFSNHRSIIDPLAIDIALEQSRIFGLWVAKKELYDSPMFGNAVKNGGCIRLAREETSTKEFFSDIKAGLEKKASICIFPEGTRNKTEKDLLAFKNGARIIAVKNRLDLLPVYIKSNARDVLNQALLDNSVQREITVIVGDIVPYAKKCDLETVYREMFDLSL